MPKNIEQESMRDSEFKGKLTERQKKVFDLVARGESLAQAEQGADALTNEFLQNAYVAPSNDPASVRARERHTTTNNS